jgi:hypothetical protein
MAEREGDRGSDAEREASELVGPEEPEPDWANDIREGRKARADRLRAVFDGFDGKLSKEPRGPA